MSVQELDPCPVTIIRHSSHSHLCGDKHMLQNIPFPTVLVATSLVLGDMEKPYYTEIPSTKALT